MTLGLFEHMLRGLYPNDRFPKILCDHTYNKAKNQDKILIKVCRSDFDDIINIVFKNDKLTKKSVQNIKPYYTKEELTDAYLDNKLNILRYIQEQYENDFAFLFNKFIMSNNTNNTDYIKDLEKIINKMVLLIIRYPGSKSPMNYLYDVAEKMGINVDFYVMRNAEIMNTSLLSLDDDYIEEFINTWLEGLTDEYFANGQHLDDAYIEHNINTALEILTDEYRANDRHIEQFFNVLPDWCALRADFINKWLGRTPH